MTVTDGVQILRAGANLSSSCSLGVCDLNANGAISVTDGVNALRRAADLPADVGCGAGISDFVADVLASTGDHPVLELGLAPVPGPAAPATIGTPEGSTSVVAGSSNDVNVPYDTTGQSQGAATAATSGLTFVLAVADLQGNLTDGIFEMPIGPAAGEVEITVVFPNDLGSQSFLLCPATRSDGVLSQYGVLRQDPVAGSPVRFTLPTH